MALRGSSEALKAASLLEGGAAGLDVAQITRRTGSSSGGWPRPLFVLAALLTVGLWLLAPAGRSLWHGKCKIRA